MTPGKTNSSYLADSNSSLILMDQYTNNFKQVCLGTFIRIWFNGRNVSIRIKNLLAHIPKLAEGEGKNTGGFEGV